MAKLKIGILHPGAMGISVAASAQNSGHRVYWVSEGRSRQTRMRAEERELLDAETLDKLCSTCEVIVSVCPPGAAEAVSQQVLACGFKGLYLDANAISPQKAVRIGERMTNGGITFVDGGIVGGPAWERGTTWLYLSGGDADRAAACFSAGPLETRMLGESIGRASALKMCYAAFTKGTTALLSAIMATAEGLGVRDELEAQWSRDGTGSADQMQGRVRRATAKAWRFVGEMEEIAATFDGAGLPGEFHAAAATIYRRMAHFKDAAEPPPVEKVLEALPEGAARGPV